MTAQTEQGACPLTASALSPERIRELCNRGIAACRLGDWQQGVDILYSVVGTAPTAREVPSLAFSYLGYGRAAQGAGYKDGLRLCKLAIRKDVFAAENYLNLARTCLLRDRRRMAIRALDRGLRVSPRHPQLHKLRGRLGWRQRPALPFLDRSNAVNRALGKARLRLLRPR